MLLETASGQKIRARDIDYILGEQIMGVEGTAVRLNDGRVVLVLHSENELVREMNSKAPSEQ